MSKRFSKVTRAEISRALRAALEAGFTVVDYSVNYQTGEVSVSSKIDNGTISNSYFDKMLGSA